MSSINFSYLQTLQEDPVVPVGLPLSEGVERQDLSIENEERGNNDKLRDTYTFLRLLHSYERLERLQQDGVVGSLIQAEKENAYQGLVKIAENHPDWQSKLPFVE